MSEPAVVMAVKAAELVTAAKAFGPTRAITHMRTPTHARTHKAQHSTPDQTLSQRTLTHHPRCQCPVLVVPMSEAALVVAVKAAELEAAAEEEAELSDDDSDSSENGEAGGDKAGGEKSGADKAGDKSEDAGAECWGGVVWCGVALGQREYALPCLLRLGCRLGSSAVGFVGRVCNAGPVMSGFLELAPSSPTPACTLTLLPLNPCAHTSQPTVPPQRAPGARQG